jgi:hypothetical protein
MHAQIIVRAPASALRVSGSQEWRRNLSDWPSVGVPFSRAAAFLFTGGSKGW